MNFAKQIRHRLYEQRQLLANIAWQGVAQIGARLLNLAVFVLTANRLGPSGLGQFIFAVTFAQVAGIFVDFGMHPILVREAVKGKAWGLFRTFSRLKLALSALVGTTALTGAVALLGLPERDIVSVALGLAAVFELSYLGLLFSLFRAEEEMAYEALFTFLHRLLYFSLALLALEVWRSANGVLAGYAISGLAAAIGAGTFAAGRYGEPESRAVPLSRGLFSQIAPLFIIDFWTMIYFRVDTLLLRTLRGYVEVGVYGAAYRLFEAMIIVPSVLAIALFPRLVEGVTQPMQGRYVRIYFLSFVLVGALGAGILFGLAQPAFSVLYGEQKAFAASQGIFEILLIAFLVLCVNYPLTQMAVASGRQKAYAMGAVIAGLVNIGLNLFAIPRYGARGAAIVTVATELTLLLFMHHELAQVWMGRRLATEKRGMRKGSWQD